MVVKKRMLLWDWTNSAGPDGGVPKAMDKVNFKGPISSVSNWNAWVPPELHGRAPYRPMIHLDRELNGNEWQMILNSDQPIIQYFNEPERNGITPQHAADAWYKQVLPLRTQKHKKLVSPACASDANGEKWLAEFMNLVKKDQPDYIGVHYYGTDVNAAKSYIEGVHKKYPTHPIIVSEIASISRNANDVKNFTVQMANWMDEQSYIFEYGFFGCMRKLADNFVSPAAQLMNPDGSFTPLMVKLMNEQPMK